MFSLCYAQVLWSLAGLLLLCARGGAVLPHPPCHGAVVCLYMLLWDGVWPVICCVSHCFCPGRVVVMPRFVLLCVHALMLFTCCFLAMVSTTCIALGLQC